MPYLSECEIMHIESNIKEMDVTQIIYYKYKDTEISQTNKSINKSKENAL